MKNFILNYNNVLFLTRGKTLKTVARITLAPGMILAEDIFSGNGEKLYSKGVKLDTRAIERIARHNIMAVTVMEDVDFASTHTEKIRLSSEFKKFHSKYYECVPAFRKIIDDMVATPSVPPINKLMAIYVQLTQLAPTGQHLLDYLVNIPPDMENMIYEHMLNSGLIASVFASWLNMSKEDTFTLIQCAFFYDIGKLRLPIELLYKPSKLTDLEFETIKTHTLLGFELLNECKLTGSIARSSLMHHERVDGSGYPSHLKLEKIDKFAQYIAIIDSYEAMSAPKTYRNSLNPFQIIANFEKDGYLKYDKDKLQDILYHIAESQVDLTAKLNDCREGIIIHINNNKISRPLIRLQDGSILDLSTEPDSIEIQTIY